MDLAEYRKNSGIEEDEQDAAVQEEELEEEQQEEDFEQEEGEEQQEEQEEQEDELPENQKTAFQKALERERRKLEEKLRAELESQYNPHKEVVNLLGGDIDKIRQTIEQQKLVEEANNTALRYGWDEEETQRYIQDRTAEQQTQRLQDELNTLRLQGEINRLSRQPEYQGIEDMEAEIMAKVKATGGALTASEAFYAIGGEKRVKQIQREMQQRETMKRTKRKPQSDGGAAPSTTVPLPKEIMAQAAQLGMTESEVRELMDTPNDLASYRKQKRRN